LDHEQTKSLHELCESGTLREVKKVYEKEIEHYDRICSSCDDRYPCLDDDKEMKRTERSVDLMLSAICQLRVAFCNLVLSENRPSCTEKKRSASREALISTLRRSLGSGTYESKDGKRHRLVDLQKPELIRLVKRVAKCDHDAFKIERKRYRKMLKTLPPVRYLEDIFCR
jgi:hypothetical protein